MMNTFYLYIIYLAVAAVFCACGNGSGGTGGPADSDSTNTEITPEEFAAPDTMKAAPENSPLQRALESYIMRQDALIGVCVITDSLMYGVNIDEHFPMMSTVKFATALAVADKEGALRDTIQVKRSDLRNDTWSPMLRQYKRRDQPIAVDVLLKYALTTSDNNAFDILTEYVGGPAAVQKHLDRLGVRDFRFQWYENQMNANWDMYPDNWCTPKSMALLIYNFFQIEDTPQTARVKALMAACKTGRNRLAAGIPDKKAVLYHKTGTAGTNPRTRRLRALNDVGYVRLPASAGGGGYAIAVFVAEANQNTRQAAKCIADISAITYRAFK